MEVDLTKPLPNKVNFKGGGGKDVSVSISYPWLPPAASLDPKGVMLKDCQGPKSNLEVVERSIVVTEAVNDSVIMEGFSLMEASGKSPSEIVTKLMEELESISGKASLSGECVPRVGDDQTLFKLAPENTSWSLVSRQNNTTVSP